MAFDPLNMTDAEIAAVRKQSNKDKAKRAEKNRKKPKAEPVPGVSDIRMAGAIGSPISGAGTAKVRASKSKLPQQNRHERLVAKSRQFDDHTMPLGDPRKDQK